MLNGSEAEREVQILGLNHAVSGSPISADADQLLRGRRTECVGDAAQPLQQHGDAPFDEIGELLHSATGTYRGVGRPPDASRVYE